MRDDHRPFADEHHDDIIYPHAVPFVLAHLVCIAAIWTGVSLEMLLLAAALYVVRMFGTTAGYHRYFSHRTYKTSRAGQLLLAVLAQSSAQRGALWWASKHRQHHQHSDTPLDPHSPVQRGFWYAHVGWIFAKRDDKSDYSLVPDLAAYPELVWLDRHQYFVPTVLALACFAVGGWQGLVVGFFWSTVVLYHGTFMINSLAHVHGRQRYLTGDDSRNNWWLAIITLGEGWHNNHHAYQRATRQGFRWWEYDPTYYVLRALSWLGLVWDLGEPPPEVVRNEHRPGRKVIDRVARELVASFPVERIADQVRTAWANAPTLAEIEARVRSAGHEAAERLAALHLPHLPHLPTLADLRHRAGQLFAHAPSVSLDEVAERARVLLVEAVSARVVAGPEAMGAT